MPKTHLFRLVETFLPTKKKRLSQKMETAKKKSHTETVSQELRKDISIKPAFLVRDM